MSQCEFIVKKLFSKHKEVCKYQILNDKMEILSKEKRFVINLESPHVQKIDRNDQIIYIDKVQKISAAIKIDERMAVEDKTETVTIVQDGAKEYLKFTQQ